MTLDCIVIGGGPAGLNASLVLGRSRRHTILFDEGQPRNAVTSESHGFLTRDGITPGEFRRLAYQELNRYPSLEFQPYAVTAVTKTATGFQVTGNNGQTYQTKTLILATGYKDVLPQIPGLTDFYGQNLFSCPFCDGWELRDKPLAIIAENSRAFHFAQVVYNWSTDLILCTNGKKILTVVEKERLKVRGVALYEEPLVKISGTKEELQFTFADQRSVQRKGGFIAADWEHATTIPQDLGCDFNQQGGIKTSSLGQTNIPGLFACGDLSTINPSQLVIAAAQGSQAAIAVNALLIQDSF